MTGRNAARPRAAWLRTVAGRHPSSAAMEEREFSIDTSVQFGALDNTPHEVVLDPETHTAYQQTYYHALGKEKISEPWDGKRTCVLKETEGAHGRNHEQDQDTATPTAATAVGAASGGVVRQGQR